MELSLYMGGKDLLNYSGTFIYTFSRIKARDTPHSLFGQCLLPNWLLFICGVPCFSSPVGIRLFTLS